MTESIRSFVRRKPFIYLVAPLLLELPLIFFYFSPFPALRAVIVPPLEGVTGNTARELGLLENLQNVCLILILFMAVKGFKVKKLRWERVCLGILFVGTLVLLLEEIDYGIHYYELFKGTPPDEIAKVRNLHNIGGTTNRLKQVADIIVALFFVVLPLFSNALKNPLLRYVVPSRWCIATVVAMVATSKFAHMLNNEGFGAGMSSNISEFRELFFYYLIAVYLFDLIFRRTYTPATSE